MSSIEDTWEDCTVYLVGFFVQQAGKRKLIHKTLIFSSIYSLESVKKHICKKFKGVTHIEYVDIWKEEALRFK